MNRRADGETYRVRYSPPASYPAPAVTTTSPDPRPTFVLLLEEPAGQWPPQAALARPGYFEWMDSLMARGRFDDGVRLAEDEGWYLATGGTAMPAGQRPVAAANYSGPFVIRARDYDEAVAIARESPHLNYGGGAGEADILSTRSRGHRPDGAHTGAAEACFVTAGWGAGR